MAYCMKAIISPTCISRIHLVSAHPDDQQHDAVHDQHHYRHHEHHNAVDEETGLGQVGVGGIELLLLVLLGVESPDDHQAGRDFARDQIEFVDQFLHRLNLGNADDEHDAHHREHAATAAAIIHSMELSRRAP